MVTWASLRVIRYLVTLSRSLQSIISSSISTLALWTSSNSRLKCFRRDKSVLLPQRDSLMNSETTRSVCLSRDCSRIWAIWEMLDNDSCRPEGYVFLLQIRSNGDGIVLKNALRSWCQIFVHLLYTPCDCQNEIWIAPKTSAFLLSLKVPCNLQSIRTISCHHQPKLPHLPLYTNI